MYGAESWGNTSAIYTTPIVYSNKIIGLLFKLSTLFHCAPFALLPTILYLPDIVKLLLLLLASNVFHNLNVPAVISRYFIKPLHNYPTRNVDYKFYIPQ